jgi:hypothetical protein
MPVLNLDIDAPETQPSVGRPKKPPTEQIRIARHVVEQVWRVAILRGYRSGGDFLTDLLPPILDDMERDLLAERAKEMGRPKRKPKGGE